MTLKKQSIRKNMHVFADGEPITKDELVKASEDWSESQENMFRKCLRQGVFRFIIKKITYKIVVDEKTDINSKGDRPVKVPPIPNERSF
jgi:hypothetical protein|tara:strand:- start:1091 stop:1357 length:267 start_codon:yes stop_codon:yes gene_type:complete